MEKIHRIQSFHVSVIVFLVLAYNRGGWCVQHHFESPIKRALREHNKHM